MVFEKKPPKLVDEFANWYEDSKGRLFTRMKIDEIHSKDLQDLGVKAFKNELPEGQKREDFTIGEEHFYISQFEMNGNVLSRIYKGVSPYPVKDTVKLPSDWGQTQISGGGKKPFVPAKQYAHAAQGIELLSIQEVSERCVVGGDLALLDQQQFPPIFDGEDAKYVCGVPLLK